MGTREIFKENLKYWRSNSGLTQEQLSEKIGYGSGYISEIESRNIFPKPETIDLICSELNILPSQLFEKRGCPVNCLKFNSEDFIQKIITELNQTVPKEMSKIIDKYLN